MTGSLLYLDPEDAVERFLAYMAPSWRDSTFNNATTRLGHLLDFLDERGIEDTTELNGRTLSDFVAWRRADVAPITLQKQLTTVRVFLRWAADIDAVPEGLAEQLHAPELPDGAESSDIVIETHRVERMLDYFERFDYASRMHAMVAILWRTGMRRGALHSLDVGDLRPEENALVLEHRPETDTYLKNGKDGERWVYLGPIWYQVVEDYVNERRLDKTDDHGRDPLLTTRYGRPHVTTISDNCYRATRPCQYTSECPVGRDIEECAGTTNPEQCPCKRGPHAFRRGAISDHLREGTPPEVVSERMNVSLDVLYKHYDVRSNREKMDVRKEHLPS
ncbi:tyrosine-type recombinase/integrase [Haloferax namakaokahaiae]|uniref:Tyrosine-type recombinase/integrase n=1 Tax=Haloferax namakaokahaiae TaxID=1748331 RepID=A0ABD5ZHX3_9EURY